MIPRRHRIAAWLAMGLCCGCSPGPSAPPAASPPSVERPAPPETNERPIAAEPAPEEVGETAASEPAEPFALEEGFAPLTLSDFQAFGAEDDTWRLENDAIVCTGKPRGYLYSNASHQNFTWRLEYRFERPKSLKDEAKFKGNTGFLVYISGEHKLWPVCLEVQGKHVQMGAIKENGGAAAVTVQDDEAARQEARRPVGEWNRLEIVSRDGALTVRVNDRLISTSQPAFLSEGKIGIQAEDHPFAVRRMRIRDE